MPYMGTIHKKQKTPRRALLDSRGFHQIAYEKRIWYVPLTAWFVWSCEVA